MSAANQVAAVPQPSISKLRYDEDDDMSDLSDGEGYCYPGEDVSKRYIERRLMATRKKRVRELYVNTDQVHFYTEGSSSL